jgi:hypothetical protein
MGLPLPFTGLLLLVKLLLKVRVLDKAFGLRVAGFITVSTVIHSTGIRRTVMGEKSSASTRDRGSLTLLLVICLLDYQIEYDRRIVFGFD